VIGLLIFCFRNGDERDGTWWVISFRKKVLPKCEFWRGISLDHLSVLQTGTRQTEYYVKSEKMSTESNINALFLIGCCYHMISCPEASSTSTNFISVLRPLIYSLNPSRDKMAGNQKCGWLRLPHVTGPIISQGRVWLYSVWGSMVRVCMGRASTFV
jgi:hypothetical protein